MMSVNNIAEVTVVHTWDNNEFEISIEYDKFIELYTNAKINWIDWLNFSAEKKFISLKNIKSFEAKKVRLLLADIPRTLRLYEMWSLEKEELLKKNPNLYFRLEKEDEERRKRISLLTAPILQKTFENRKKKFLKEREKILKDLSKKEKEFWLETTLYKVNKYNENLNLEKIKVLKQKS